MDTEVAPTLAQRIDDILQKREAIYQFAQKWADNVGHDLGEILREVEKLEGRGELEELANYIYWNEAELPRFPNISIKGVIKDIYQGITGTRFSPQKTIEKPCPACGETVQAPSISKLKELESCEAGHFISPELSISGMCCEDCYQLTLEYTHRRQNVLLYPNPFIHQNVSMDYSAFLQTDYWKSIREHIKNRDGGECVMCGSRSNLHIHHKNYRHRGYEFRNDLHTLCGDCHAKFHGKDGQL